MKVIYHLGVHATDKDRIIDTLIRNAKLLRRDGITVPPPERYREALSQTLRQPGHEDSTSDSQTDMMDLLGPDSGRIERLVLSDAAFMGEVDQAVGNNRLYPMLEDRIGTLVSMFDSHEVELCLGLCNPAILISEVFRTAQEDDLPTFLGGSDPMQLRWSETLSRLAAAAPRCKITVWANEDTPFTWPEVLRAVSGHAAGRSLEGIDDFYEAMMRPGGLRRMSSYFEAHPPPNPERYKSIVERFLDKFGQEDRVETEIDLPGWSASYVDAVTDLYDRDIDAIARMPGITFIAS